MNNKQEQTWTKACTRFFWQREMIRSEVTAKCSTEETATSIKKMEYCSSTAIADLKEINDVKFQTLAMIIL